MAKGCGKNNEYKLGNYFKFGGRKFETKSIIKKCAKGRIVIFYNQATKEKTELPKRSLPAIYLHRGEAPSRIMARTF